MPRPRKAEGRGAAVLAARARGVAWKCLARQYGCCVRTLEREAERAKAAGEAPSGVLSRFSGVLSHRGACAAASVSASLGPVLIVNASPTEPHCDPTRRADAALAV